jgi:L-Ala-D/L-Glu epimerase
MISSETRTMSLKVDVEQWPLSAPFRITGYTFETARVVTVTLEKEGRRGRGEASGVYYLKDDVSAMVRQIEQVRARIEAGIDRNTLQHILPRGGARNAVDCALWDLEAKLLERPAWQIAGLAEPRPLLTTFTVGAGTPDKMALGALAYTQAKAIKLKLTGGPDDGACVQAVRAARPDVWLAVDANQGFTRESLLRLMPILVEARVQLIEQPFRIGEEAHIDGVDSPIPIAADESVQDFQDIRAMADRFTVINIKLDKCGGLTEGLAMAHECRRLGLDVMVGNMTGTSLAMAPAFLVGQLCDVVDLDGPVFLKKDRSPSIEYDEGMICSPANVWGSR